MYDQPFDIIEIYVDDNESYPNPYGFSVRILRALYILNNKIVFKYQPEDSSITIKKCPKI